MTSTVLRPVLALALGLVLIGVAQAVAGSGGTRTVELVVEHSRYLDTAGRPVGEIAVRDGETVRFLVRNDDPITHELIAGDLVTQEGHENGTDRHHDGAHGAVTVRPGETAETVHTFAGRGTHWVGCHLPGHWDHGMRIPVRMRG